MIPVYHPKHDAHFDAVTFEWLDGQCTDDTCEFCAARPELAYSKEFDEICKLRFVDELISHHEYVDLVKQVAERL